MRDCDTLPFPLEAGTNFELFPETIQTITRTLQSRVTEELGIVPTPMNIGQLAMELSFRS